MKERAKIFFILLNQSYKVDAEEKLQQLSVSAYPHMKKEDSTRIVNNYKSILRDPLDLIEYDDDYSGIDVLRNKLNKKS